MYTWYTKYTTVFLVANITLATHSRKQQDTFVFSLSGFIMFHPECHGGKLCPTTKPPDQNKRMREILGENMGKDRTDLDDRKTGFQEPVGNIWKY